MAGRKPRDVLSTPPQKGFYLIEWEINELIRWSGISDLALRLWLTLKGLSWQMGQCDPTDEWLADWMGGVSIDAVRRARRELEDLHLLLTHSDKTRRWLTPLPVTRGLRDKLPATVALQTDEAVVALRELIHQKELAGRVALPPPAGGGNAIDLARPLKQQQLSIKEKVVDVIKGEGGVGGEGHPQAPALAADLQGLGAYPPIAVELAGQLLARMEPEEARAYVHAQRLALLDGQPRDRKLPPRDVLVKLWVSRLRFGTPAAPEMLARARARLETGEDATADPWARPRPFHPLEMMPEPEEEEEEPASVRPTPPEPEPLIACTYRGAPRDLTPAALWDVALNQLRLQMTQPTFESCLLGTRGVGLTEEGALVVEVANAQVIEVLRRQLNKIIARVLTSIVGRDLPITFRARE